MTAATVLRQGEPSGLRPVDPSRDLVRVATLIQTAFADDLDQAGRSMLRDMRNLGRLGPVLWWLDQPNIGIGSVLSGFVWVEGGEVVGFGRPEELTCHPTSYTGQFLKKRIMNTTKH